ncbi:flavoprotein [Marispirochaeta sp.]|uniref:flavoprotein n=1 Tax=Marispirochaeta sp. TaxID=2038653 RepID=UPI0029C6FC80|nr:flavoprotein [Marispirochaeta sp.]
MSRQTDTNPAAARVLLMISGSIAAYKAAELASLLVQSGFSVQCVRTEAAGQFLGDSTLEGLTGNLVLNGMFEPGRALDHIRLAESADLLLMYPATASRVTRLAAGVADDLIGALFLANNFRKPWWIAPAMNSNMFAHPAIREALEKLADWGCRVLPTGKGRMACGSKGPGRLLEPEAAVVLIKEEFA